MTTTATTERVWYVAITERDRGGGPKVGSARVDILVIEGADVPPGLPHDRLCDAIERVATERAGVRFPHVFGIY